MKGILGSVIIGALGLIGISGYKEIQGIKAKKLAAEAVKQDKLGKLLDATTIEEFSKAASPYTMYWCNQCRKYKGSFVELVSENGFDAGYSPDNNKAVQNFAKLFNQEFAQSSDKLGFLMDVTSNNNCIRTLSFRMIGEPNLRDDIYKAILGLPKEKFVEIVKRFRDIGLIDREASETLHTEYRTLHGGSAQGWSNDKNHSNKFKSREGSFVGAVTAQKLATVDVRSVA